MIATSQPDAINHSAEALYKMSEVELLTTYAEARHNTSKRSSRAIPSGRELA